MKKFFVFTGAIACVFLFSCSNNNTGTMSEKAKKNLENARAVAKSFETKDISKLNDYIADDVVDHAAPGGESKGIDNLKKMFTQMEGAMTNSKMDVIKEIADDNYVFQWMKESWTQTQESMGMKPGDYSFNMIEVSKFNANSKITEHWSFIDVNDAMKMTSQPMSTGTSPMNKMDTTTKH